MIAVWVFGMQARITSTFDCNLQFCGISSDSARISARISTNCNTSTLPNVHLQEYAGPKRLSEAVRTYTPGMAMVSLFG